MKTRIKKLFGTDGVRGIANQEPMTSEMAMKLGRAAAYKQSEVTWDEMMRAGEKWTADLKGLKA